MHTGAADLDRTLDYWQREIGLRPAQLLERRFRDVIEAVEGPITLNLCVEGGTQCSLQPTCRMFRVWEEGQRSLLDIFSHTTIREIASSKPSPSFFNRMQTRAAAAELAAAQVKN